MIPNDRYSSGYTDRDCWAVVHSLNKEIVDKKCDKYKADYPTRGYNTHIEYCKKMEGYWEAKIVRWHSCH